MLASTRAMRGKIKRIKLEKKAKHLSTIVCAALPSLLAGKYNGRGALFQSGFSFFLPPSLFDFHAQI